MPRSPWKDAWTGGQYSLVRAVSGAVLAAALATTALQAPLRAWFPAALAVAAAAVATGAGGRPLALGLAALLPFGLVGSGHEGLSILASAWMLAHAFLPPAPFGSSAALGREDPAGTWAMPGWFPPLWQLLFVLLVAGRGLVLLGSDEQTAATALLVAAALAAVPRTAPAGWLVSAVTAVSLGSGHGGGGAATAILHLVALQPAWVPRPTASTMPAVVFYDGDCALCHGAVRFVMAEDRDPARFRVAPLDGPTFLETVPEAVRVTRPDSLLVVAGGEVLLRSQAVGRILWELGGLWTLFAVLLRAVPPALLDRLYDVVAANRRSWFGEARTSCPLLTERQRSRLDP